MVKVIAEIGINHNGSIELAKKLIDAAVDAGADYVKFQKRDPDTCVPEEMKTTLRDTPWGQMTYLDYKKKLELSHSDYREINSYCESKGIKWFLSVWDVPSVHFARFWNHEMVKIPSALALDNDLLEFCRYMFDQLIVSVGMCDGNQIEQIINKIRPNVVMHTNSSYPTPVDELNLLHIEWLKEFIRNNGYEIEVGYSGHELGLIPTLASVALGATWIERHITLDRTMWGSDQSASIEPIDFKVLVNGIREVEKSLGEFGPRKVTPSEHKKIKSLRK